VVDSDFEHDSFGDKIESDDRPYHDIKDEQENSARKRHADEFMNASREPRIALRAKPSPDAVPTGLAANDIGLRERTLFDRAGEFVKQGYDRMRGIGRNTNRVVPSSGGRRTRRVRFR
jgi:hypothetical protein